MTPSNAADGITAKIAIATAKAFPITFLLSKQKNKTGYYEAAVFKYSSYSSFDNGIQLNFVPLGNRPA